MLKKIKCVCLVTAMLFFKQLVFAQAETAYNKSINTWHKARIENLKKENGWLNLVGLYWLEKGVNSFGSGSNNKLVFPVGSIPAEAGYFELNDTIVTLIAKNGVALKVDNKPITREIIFSNTTGTPIISSYGSLRWTIIKRNNKIGVRLRDLQSKELTSFKDIDCFPIDEAFRVTAILDTINQPASISITNILGQTNLQHFEGKLRFTLGGKSYSLDALEEEGDLFVIFADPTNKQFTYPSGRFLLVKKPGADGRTIIDFNQAYNPPCAFTNFATCPLPPRQNILPVPITAGEKKWGNH